MTENGSGDDSLPSDVESKVIRQIEYYFGDHNLCRDKFLQEEIKKEQGWIPLTVMLKFKRLAQITEDTAVITTALGKSKNELVEVHEDKTKIRRNPEKKIPEMNNDWKEEVQSRTLYMKGFPTEAVLDDLIPFVDKICQSENVFMRRFRAPPSFKGSIFVTYKTIEDCNKVLDSKGRKFKEEDDEPIIIKFQKDYQDDKHKERKEKNKGGGMNEEKSAQKQGPIHKGAVLKIDGVDAIGELTIDDIKAIFAEKVTQAVAWVTFKKGDSTVKIRFDGENSAADVIQTLGGNIKLNDKSDAKLELKLVEGQEEEDYWQEFRRDTAKKNFHKGGGRGGGRGGRGGRGRGGGRGGDKRHGGGRDNDEPQIKKKKLDDDD